MDEQLEGRSEVRTLESMDKGLKERLWNLDNWVRNALILGVVRYDRSGVVKKDTLDYDEGAGVVKISPMAETQTAEDLVEDVCPNIAKWVQQNAVQDGVLDVAETYYVADPKTNEAHWVVVGEIRSEDDTQTLKVLVDMGYSQPVPRAVPLTGDVVTARYQSPKSSGQIYAGEVAYQAQEEEDGQVRLEICEKMEGTDGYKPPVKSFLFKRVIDDKKAYAETARVFATATAGFVKTAVSGEVWNLDGSLAFERESIKEGTLDEAQLGRLAAWKKVHTALQGGADIKFEVV